jgi:hypothetical protein
MRNTFDGLGGTVRSEQKSQLTIAAVAAAAALLGAALGALVTGYFQLRSQEIAANQTASVERSQASRALELDWANDAAEYMADLQYLRGNVAGQSVSQSDYTARGREFDTVTWRLVMKSDTETADRIVAANEFVHTEIDSGLPTRSTPPTSGPDPIDAALTALYAKAAMLRAGAPGFPSDDAIGRLASQIPTRVP